MKNESFKSYSSSLSASADTDYSIWKATRRMKRPRVHAPPIRKEDGTCCDQDKVELYVCHLFQPNNIVFELDIEQCEPLNEIREKIKNFTLIEIAKEIDTNINPKSHPGMTK